MDRFVFGFAAVALMVLGVGMVIWPAGIVRMDRDDGDVRPPTAGEVWRTRLLGVMVLAGSAYFLYAIVTKMPGGEFAPA